MNEQMSKSEFLRLVQEGRARWDALLGQIEEERMSVPGADGEWSVKDTIAHISWCEREMIGVLEANALVGSDLWQLPHDERNAAIYEENRQRSLQEVLEEARALFPRLLTLLQALPEEALNDPGHFREMPAEWAPWEVLASNTYEHYEQHAPAIRAWLARATEES